MSARPPPSARWFALLLGLPLLAGCRHADALSTPPLPEAEAMTSLSHTELLAALTRMVRGAQQVRHFTADDVASQLGHPLQSNATGPEFFGTGLSLADGSGFSVTGVGVASAQADRLDLEFEPALGHCPLNVAALQPVLADAGATHAQWGAPIRLGSVAQWRSTAGPLAITATVDGKHGEADTDACIRRISLQITGER